MRTSSIRAEELIPHWEWYPISVPSVLPDTGALAPPSEEVLANGAFVPSIYTVKFAAVTPLPGVPLKTQTILCHLPSSTLFDVYPPIHSPAASRPQSTLPGF